MPQHPELPHLRLLYRGPLSSCNYGCPYCPFAKHQETPAEHRADAQALERFVAWVGGQTRPLSVFFTPWGEALIWPRYQAALNSLSQLPHIQQLAVQTNLSGKLDWLSRANLTKIGLWATYHPGEVRRERFLAKCAELDALGVRYSVGVVGKREHFSEIAALREQLAPNVYLWVNAFKVGPDYYSAQDLTFLIGLDPLFEVNTRFYPSRSQRCEAGETSLSVDGAGTVYRCHFVKRPLGNLYTQDLASILKPRRCPRATCECHIGYVQLPQLDAERLYGPGLLARIPEGPEWAAPEPYLARARQLLDRGFS